MTSTAAVKVHNGHEYRESGVPGIVIFGTSALRNFALYVKITTEYRGERFVLVTHRDINEWPTVREARAAAQRIADLLPGTPPTSTTSHSPSGQPTNCSFARRSRRRTD